MNKREELIEQLKTQYENEFRTLNGYFMNRKQKKELAKRIEKMVDKKLKEV